MVVDKGRSIQILKRLWRPAIVLVLSLLLLLNVLWYILRSDHAFIIRKLREAALAHWNVHLQLDGYRLEWARPYTLIHFRLNGLSLAPADDPQQPVFRVNHLTSEFNPWNLLTGNFQTHPLLLDSAWIHLYSDSSTYHSSTSTQAQPGNEANGLDVVLERLPSVAANYLDFYRQDDYQHKWQRARFSGLEMVPKLTEQGVWALHMQSRCHFDGLVFKPEDGGFLMDTPAELELWISLAEQGQTVRWDRSTLRTARNEFALAGYYHWADTNSIQLHISSEGVVLADALPLLSDKIQLALCDIQVDRPVRTAFSLNNLIVPGRKEAIELSFATEDAEVRYKGVQLLAATVNGQFSNDCDQDGIGAPQSSCIRFHQLDGDFFGVLPASLQGLISNMEAPTVEASGRMDVDLPRLNPLLAEKNKATFAEGSALVHFQYDGSLAGIVSNPFDDLSIEVDGNAVFDKVRLATAGGNIASPSLSGYLTFDENHTLLEDIDLAWMGANIQLSGRISNLPEFLFYDEQTLISDLALHFDHLDLRQFVNRSPARNKDRKNTPLTGNRLEIFTQQLAGNINGQLLLDIDTLSYDTLFLTGLNTRLHLLSPRRTAPEGQFLLRMDSLSGRFMGHTPVFAGLRVSTEDIPDLEVKLKLPAAVRVLNSVLPANTNISGGGIHIELSARMPLRSVLENGGLAAGSDYQGFIRLEEVTVKNTTMPQPLHHLTGRIRFDQQQLLLEDLQFQYDSAPFSLSGKVDRYTPFGKIAGKKAVADLQLKGAFVDLRPGKNTARAKGSPKRPSPPEFFRSLGRFFRHAGGKIDLALDSVITKSRTLYPVQVQARLLPDDEHYQLAIDSFTLGLGGNDQFSGNALIKDPDHPVVDGQLSAQLSFDKLGSLLPSEYLDMRAGRLEMDLQYRSPLYDTLNAGNYLLNAHIDGRAELKDGAIFYNYRGFLFDQISGHLRFDERALFIDELEFRVNGNYLVANGRSSDFFPFFVLPDRRVTIDMEVSSPRFDFGDFTAPQGLSKNGPRNKVRKPLLYEAGPRLPEAAPADSTGNALRRTVGYIDQLLDEGSVDMSTDIREVIYHDFKAQAVEGHISLVPDTVQLHQLKMEVAGGRFTVGGLISDIVRHEPRMELALEMEKNNVREIFRQFDNFGQQELKFDNIKGLISANLKFSADINSNYEILPASMRGDLGVTLAGGELIDLKVFDKLSGFLFRNRGMDHIFLDTLDLFSHIRGSDLYVDNFYLHSSSFDFGAMGRYSLGADNKTRILFSVPIRNLFRRHIPLEEIREGKSKRKGINILIEARYKKGRMRFIWRPFVLNRKKFRLIE